MRDRLSYQSRQLALATALSVCGILVDLQKPDTEKSIAVITLYISYVAYLNFCNEARQLHANLIWLTTVILLTFFLPITNLSRWTICGLIIFLFIATGKKKVQRMYFPILKPLNIYLAANLVVKLLIIKIESVVQFLSFGYDNAFHLMVYRGIRETSWLPVTNVSEWWSDFGLFKSTPIGSSALFSFLASLFIGSSKNPTNETATYFLINLIILLLIIVFACQHILGINVKNKTRLPERILIFAFILTIFLTAGTLFVNGFPPYNLALLIIIVCMNILEKPGGEYSKLLTVSASVFCIILITPAPVAFLLLPGLVLLIKVIKMELNRKNYIKLLLGLVLIGVLAFTSLYSFRNSSATLGWRQILAPGGVDKPNTQLSILLIILFLLFVFTNYSMARVDYSFLIALSGTASMVFFITLNLIFTNNIQYYSVKQFYLWSALVSVLLYKYLFSATSRHRFLRYSIVSKLLAVVPVSSILFSLHASNGFMENLPNSLLAISRQNYSQGYLVDGTKQVHLSKTDKLPENICLFYRVDSGESDLNSRWANALSSPIFMSEDCFGIYWNSSDLSLTEIESRAALTKTRFVYVVGTKNEAKFQELIERNRFFVIGRKLIGESSHNE